MTQTTETQSAEAAPQLTLDWVLAQRKSMEIELDELLTPHIPVLTDEIIRDLIETLDDVNPCANVEYAWIGTHAEALTGVQLGDTYGRRRVWLRLTDLLIPSLEARGFVNRIQHNGEDGFDVYVDELTPYTAHLARVSQRVSDDIDACIVAWLHDIVEDTSMTMEKLRSDGAGFSNLVLEAVDLLTKKKDVSYEDYLAAIKQHPLACKVKIADMLDNLSDNPTRKQIIKYTKGLLYLHDELPRLSTDCPICSSQAKLDKALTIARELLAAIRINALRGTFAGCTQEQIDDFLAPKHEALKDL